YIFSAALEGHYPILAVVGVLNSVISVYYYFRVIVIMYMNEPVGQPSVAQSSAAAFCAVALAALGTLQIGLFPARLLDLARQSVGTFGG
ncbi:MAG: NADH-quinone oxidoreductase subunit N, partial [Candidatus Methylomirabilaceae bacterium]